MMKVKTTAAMFWTTSATGSHLYGFQRRLDDSQSRDGPSRMPFPEFFIALPRCKSIAFLAAVLHAIASCCRQTELGKRSFAFALRACFIHAGKSKRKTSNCQVVLLGVEPRPNGLRDRHASRLTLQDHSAEAEGIEPSFCGSKPQVLAVERRLRSSECLEGVEPS